MRDVVNYEGLYTINSNGDVFSVAKNLQLRAATVKDGVLKVCLTKDGIAKRKSVHRLVAEAFIPNPDNKPQVDHIDGNKHNNSVHNLRWCTNQENQQYREQQGNSGKEHTAKPVKWGDNVYTSIRALAAVIAASRNSSAETVRKELKAVRYGGKTLYGAWCELV